MCRYNDHGACITEVLEEFFDSRGKRSGIGGVEGLEATLLVFEIRTIIYIERYGTWGVLEVDIES